MRIIIVVLLLSLLMGSHKGFSQVTLLDEDFEGLTPATFPPPNWTRISFYNNQVWLPRAVSGLGADTVAAQMDNWTNFGGTGFLEWLITPGLDISGFTSASLSFYVSYRRYDATYSDTLMVRVTTDTSGTGTGGGTWTQVFKKGGTDLSGGAADYQSIQWVPSIASDWILETIDLTAYAGQNPVFIGFVDRCGEGQKLYIDQVNVTASGASGLISSASKESETHLSCSPNPFSQQTNLNYSITAPSDVKLNLYNILGERVATIFQGHQDKGSYNFELDALNNFPQGLYFCSLEVNGRKKVIKIVKQ